MNFTAMPDYSNPEYQTLSLGFSPCPNDTFLFDAMVHGKIDTEGLRFEVMLEDVESLNRKALNDVLDVTKLSFAVFIHVTSGYQLLHSGSALGKGIGPLVVSKTAFLPSVEAFQNKTIAIPGRNTTANFLFSIFFPDAKKRTEMIFSEIENAVLAGKADAGVIIHESRFTYEQRGLKKICDLGEWWEKETGMPVPLGGIAVKKNLPEALKQKIGRVMKRSVEYAIANPQESQAYVKQHAQEMDNEVRKKHIEAYVNDFSLELGDEGRNAIMALFEKAKDAGMIPLIPLDIFVSHDRNVNARASQFGLF